MKSIPTTMGSPVRMNGFVRFSKPIVVGRVGSLFERRSEISSMRLASVSLSGSTETAKRAFDWVYSWPQ
jgi:hypothetical protein